MIASNTSSLSISKIGEALGVPQPSWACTFSIRLRSCRWSKWWRARKSSAEALGVTLIAEAWGKTVVRCTTTRPASSSTAWRGRSISNLSASCRTATPVSMRSTRPCALDGFKMGPFELTDLIGHDVNTATTQSVWEQLGKPARLRPSKLQQQLVADGHLGRKSGRGTYTTAWNRWCRPSRSRDAH